MFKELPAFIDPKRLASQATNLKGVVALAQMSRLRDMLYGIQGEAYIDWLFALDDKSRPIINGRLQAQMTLFCQRCLQPMLYPVDVQVALIVLTEKLDNDDESTGYEPIILNDAQVSLVKLIEDELILAMPIIAKHTTCPSNNYQLDENISENNNIINNPFQALSALKKAN
jgi:uncharacterized protein